ncbi:uncharacterized protein PRCAT00003184001 [Priceomyces carsonii]|uniref:uncharacterized protein n=1 Tax=Priceomyces carsonii TaxID=28549 RepID=UPI002ED8D1B1|nr:unnamed protein product [Priceomyces carsonii]
MTLPKDFDVDEVLNELSLAEKIGLLSGIDFWHTFPVHRLGLPSIRLSDGPNGVRGTKFFNGVPSACFPCGTALASTFNKSLLNDVGHVMADEARHKGAHVILGPTTNMQRGVLGGRGFESFSEDPYLAGLASASIISGIQDKGIAATIKHFVGNDLEHERSSSDSVISERALREIYLEPFRLAIKHASPVALMTAYNKVNGVHASQNKKLLQDVLRDEWKYDGTIMSDWFGTYTSKDAIENGLDLEMPGPTLFRRTDEIAHMILSKELHSKHLNSRVKNVLKLLKYTSGSNILENAKEDTLNDTSKTRKFLRTVAAESIVLLKNEDNILPLRQNEKIAVIGPNAKQAIYCGGGSAALVPYSTVTPFEGIVNKLGTLPRYTVGAYGHKALPGASDSVKNPITGEKGFNLIFYLNPSSESDRYKVDEINLNLSRMFLADYYNDKIKSNLYYVDLFGDFTPEETAEYEFSLTVLGTAQLFIDDRLVVDNKTKQKSGESFFGGGTIEVKNVVKLQKDHTYSIRIEFGSLPTFTLKNENVINFGGGGGLYVGMAKVIDPAEERAKAVEIARSVDKVVLCIGLNSDWESEGFDRSNMRLPGHTDELVSAILDVNSNTVIVNQSGTPVEFPWLSKAKSVVQAWYGGNETGNAIADVLFGDVNPCGKLSLTFPYKNVDNPTYLNFKTERGKVLYGEGIYIGYRFYEKLDREVAFPFGHGLSYTTFAYSDLKLDKDETSDRLFIKMAVANTGNRDGSECAQVYIASNSLSISRPIKELKGFEKIFLRSKESKTIEFELSLKDSVSFWDEYQEEWCMEMGDYEIQIGSSSDKIELKHPLQIQSTKFWVGI